MKSFFFVVMGGFILTASLAAAESRTHICTEVKKTTPVKCVDQTQIFRIQGQYIYGLTELTGDTRKVIHVWTVDNENVGQYSLRARKMPWHAVTYTHLRTTPGLHDVHLDVYTPDGRTLEKFHIVTGVDGDPRRALLVADKKDLRKEDVALDPAPTAETAQVKAATPSPDSKSIAWSSARAAGIATYQPGFSSYSAMAQWAPSVRLTDSLSLGPEVGISSFSLDGGDQFVALELALLGVYRFNESWSAALSLGAQNWAVGGYGTAFMAGLEGRYSLKMSFLDYVFVAWRNVDNRALTQEALAGVGIVF